MKGVLLAGGTGSRLRPITHTGPKQLVPVANKPVIEYAIEDLREAGITEIGVILGNKGRKEIQSYLGDGSELGVEITYIIQGRPLGLAHAVGCAKSFVADDDFVVYLGDNMLKRGIIDVVESFQSNTFDAGIALQEVDNPTQFGIAEVDGDGAVVRLVEKPDDPPSNLALIGIYVFTPRIFEGIEAIEASWRGELEITDAIQWLLDNNGSIDSQVVSGWWKDTGKPEDILEANRLVLEDLNSTIAGTVESEAQVDGRVDLAESATIESGAVVRGPVTIAEQTTIASGTYIGPYTSVGRNSMIKNVHLENSVVVGDTTITATGRIIDSLIGRGANIYTAKEKLPEGRRLVIGENSQLEL